MFKFIGHHWETRRERFYRKNRWHLIVDFTLGLLVILIAAFLITLNFYQPSFNWFGRQAPIVRPELDLNNPPLSINYSVDSPSIGRDEGVLLKIKLINSAQIEAQNIRVNLLLIDKNFRINKIEVLDDTSSEPRASINNREINFGNLGAGESRLLSLKIALSGNKGSVRYLDWQAQSEYSVQGQILKEIYSLPRLVLAAEINSRAYIYYNSPQGDQLGSGPLPPRVGLPTNYWVFFESQGDGDFKDFVFSAKLAPNVELVGNRSVLAGDLKYNALTRQMIWSVPEIKNGSDSYRVGFEVQYIPDLNQVDKIIPLVRGIKLYARDIQTGEEYNNTLDDLSTNLDFDRLNKGEGKVELP